MPKALSTWIDAEAIRRIFLLTPEDLLFLRPMRADAQRLYRALVLLWARIERALVSDPTTLPTEVVAHVSKQLGLKPSVLAELRNPPSARSATFEAVRTHLKVRAWEPKDADVLSAYLVSKVAQTGNTAALFDTTTDWLTRHGVLRPQGETTIDRLVYQPRTQAEDDLFEQIAAQLTNTQCETLDRMQPNCKRARRTRKVLVSSKKWLKCSSTARFLPKRSVRKSSSGFHANRSVNWSICQKR